VSESQFFALLFMAIVGFAGVPVFIDGGRKRWRIAGAVWAVAWWLPPLVLLWVKGVFG
jgi:hypothetical protein